MTGTTIDAIDFVSITMVQLIAFRRVRNSIMEQNTNKAILMVPELRHSFMQLATLEMGQLAMHFMVSSAQMFSHFSARSIELKILICFWKVPR